MTEPHWNESDPAADPAWDRIEAAPPGQQDDFPAGWGDEPTERDQAAIDSGAADDAIAQDLIDAGWTPPPGWGVSGHPASDGDPALAQIDAGPGAGGNAAPDAPAFHPADPMADDGLGADIPVWD